MKFYYSTTNCSNAAGLAFCQRYRFRLHLRQVAYFVWRLLGDKITSGDSWGNFLPFPSSNTKDGYPASRRLFFPTLHVCKIMQIAVFSCSLSLLKSTMPSNSIFFDIQLPSLLTSIESKWKRAKTRERLPAYVHYGLKIRIPKRLQILALIFLSIPTPTINFVTISEAQSPSITARMILFFQKSQVHTGRNHWPGIKSASLQVT